MSSISLDNDDMKIAVYNSLVNRGSAKAIKAKIRAEVFASLSDPTSTCTNLTANAPPDVILCNELIRDYLLKMGYQNALSVFNTEHGVDDSSSVIDRGLLAREAGLKVGIEDDETPLMLIFLQNLRDKKDIRAADIQKVGFEP